MSGNPHDRRRQIIAVLNPGGAITYPHLDYAVDLAVQYGWNIEPVTAGDGGARANRITRTIWTPPIECDESLALFAHEGGHVQDRLDTERRYSPHPVGQHCRVSIAGEVEAWGFAMRHLGRRWNQAMHQHMVKCLWSYGQGGHYFVDSATERVLFDDVIAASREQARGVVRLLPNAGRGLR